MEQTLSQNLEPTIAFYQDLRWGYASIDYSVSHDSNPSIRVGPDYIRGTREVDGAWIEVNPGDHIVFTAWIKTSTYTSKDPMVGARIGMDFYITTSQGTGIATIDAAGHQAGHPNDNENAATEGRVPWGNDWTQITWDLYVPTTYFTYVTKSTGVTFCNPVQISSMVTWLDARGVTDNAYAWFSDTQFYINP
jgi:hypothetical protein